MNGFMKLGLVGLTACCGMLTAYAVTQAGKPEAGAAGNSYYLYTKALKVDDAGVVAVPSRFLWSVETSVAGIDLQGNYLPDERVALRLYDPDHNFTALTAQMDLETATKLQEELAEIIAKKRQDPTFQHRPQLYDAKDIPLKSIVGVRPNGVLILEDEPAAAQP